MDKYVDIHSHILYGIDDGSKSLKESIEILKQYAEMGFKYVTATPHYIENSKYMTDNEGKENILETLETELKFQNIDVKLFLGNEVFTNNNLTKLLKNNQIATLNGSKYLLIELPMQSKLKNITDIIYELRIKGITPIIAHPERYSYVQEDISYVNKLIEEGALLQANYGSIVGVYGEHVKKTIKKLLKEDVISFLATDIHFPNNKIYLNIDKARKKIIKIIGEKKAQELMIINPKKVLLDEEIN